MNIRILAVSVSIITLTIGYCAGRFCNPRASSASMSRSTPSTGYTPDGKLPVYLSVHDATILMALHITTRRKACVLQEEVRGKLDMPKEDARRRVQIGYLVPCLRAVDVMPCVVVGRWIGELDSDSPDPCRAMFGVP